MFSGPLVTRASYVWGSKWGPLPVVVPLRIFSDKDGPNPHHRVGGHILVEPSHIAPVACASGGGVCPTLLSSVRQSVKPVPLVSAVNVTAGMSHVL